MLVGLGIVVWGLGASLGFPVGMSAAADDPARAAARVSVVSTIGYGAFLAGPPLLGTLGDRVGTLESLLVVAALMVPAALTVFATRRPAAHADVIARSRSSRLALSRGDDWDTMGRVLLWIPSDHRSVVLVASAGGLLLRAGRDLEMPAAKRGAVGGQPRRSPAAARRGPPSRC